MGVQILTDVFGSDGDGSSQLSDKLFGVKADLNDVIEKSKKGGQWKRGHKQGHHPKLDD